MAVVTISRELGSGGDAIAAQVAEQLGYELVDYALIVKVAERAGVSVENAEVFDEKYQSRAVEWLKSFIEPRVGKILTDGGKHLDPHAYIEYCKTVIRGLAEEGRVVIVGRAGQFILGDEESAFHVRIIADIDFRIARVMDRRGVLEPEAFDLIKKSDSMRTHYIERYFKTNWNDLKAYHLVVDSSKLGIDQSADLVSEAARNYSLAKEYVPGERDRRKGKDRRDKERRRGDRRETGVGVTQKDVTQKVLRDGRPPRTLSKPDRRKDERRKTARREENGNGDT